MGLELSDARDTLGADHVVVVVVIVVVVFGGCGNLVLAFEMLPFICFLGLEPMGVTNTP